MNPKVENRNYSYLYFPVTLSGIEGELHITVKFIGRDPVTRFDVEETVGSHDQLVSLATAAREELLGHGPEVFTDLWAPFSADRNRRPVHVVRLTDTPRLNALHEALEPLRFDDFPVYNPHVTVPPWYWVKLNKVVREFKAEERLLPWHYLVEGVGQLNLKSCGERQQLWA